MLPIANALAFDAMTAHWEFAYGPAGFRSLARELNYPVLAINCYELATGELAYSPFTILERGGLLVGVIGIASSQNPAPAFRSRSPANAHRVILS